MDVDTVRRRRVWRVLPHHTICLKPYVIHHYKITILVITGITRSPPDAMVHYADKFIEGTIAFS
jgi:hypothetical protein